MFKIHQHFIFLCLLFISTNTTSVPSCIPNTPCKCLLAENSFALMNCSHSLPNLPLFNSDRSGNITKIIASHALFRWPSNLCAYSNINALDLSGSYFDSQFINLSCLSHLVYFNLSNTRLKKVPNFRQYSLKYLQVLDLSNNQIEILDGNLFRTLINLKFLTLENNPLRQIDYFERFLNLLRIERINLISTSSSTTIKPLIDVSQWISLAEKWNNSNKSLAIRTNTFSLQSIFPDTSQFHLIPLDAMNIILTKLSNSTFTTLFLTPKCNCTHLRDYQRVYSFIYHRKLPPLFQSTTCLMPNGIIHARLFDYRTFIDLNCSYMGKSIQYTTTKNSCSFINYDILIHCFLIFYVVLIY